MKLRYEKTGMPPYQTFIVTRALGPTNLSWLWEAGNTLLKEFVDPGENKVLLPSRRMGKTHPLRVIPYMQSRHNVLNLSNLKARGLSFKVRETKGSEPQLRRTGYE